MAVNLIQGSADKITIPGIPQTVDIPTRGFLNSVKQLCETLQGTRGESGSQVITQLALENYLAEQNIVHPDIMKKKFP